MTQRYKVIAEGMEWVAGVRIGEDGTVTLSERAAEYDLARGNIEPVEEAQAVAETPPARKQREG